MSNYLELVYARNHEKVSTYRTRQAVGDNNGLVVLSNVG